MVGKTAGVKRYNLVLPRDLYDEVSREAEKRGATFIELMRKFIQIGLLTLKVQEDPNAALILREGDTDSKLLIF